MPNFDKYNWAFLTFYSQQHGAIKNIFKNHGRFLGPLIPERPDVIYRGVSSLRNIVAPYIVDPPRKSLFFQELNPCHKCGVCRVYAFKGMKMYSFSSNKTNKIY